MKRQPKKKNTKKISKQLPSVQSKEISKKTKNSEQEKKENYISWTNPKFVEKNNRWEFYQKDNQDQILEIYHSEGEEEIKSMHKSKVMSHIMAAMHQPKLERKKEGEPVRVNDINNRGRSEQGKKKNRETSIYLHNNAKFTIMKMKLEGNSHHDISIKIKEEFGLSFMTIGLYFSQVMAEIRDRAKGTVEKTIEDHLMRYEELFKWFRENGYTKAALKALDRKERLLGLHDGERVEKLILDGLVEGSLSQGFYDWSRLSNEEKHNLLTLVKRCIIILKPTESKENEK